MNLAESQGWRKRPPPLRLTDGESAVFAKFERATYDLTFGIATEEVRVSANISLRTFERGRPVVDLGIPTLGSVEAWIDGKRTSLMEVWSSPTRRDGDVLSSAAVFSAIQESIPAGCHEVEIQYSMPSSFVTWSEDGVSCRFEYSDYRSSSHRFFLNHYLPSNWEYDQHPIDLIIRIVDGRFNPHVVLANGLVGGNQADEFTVSYPAWYSCSCPFLLIAPADEITIVRHPIRGRQGTVPLTVFSQTRGEAELDEFANQAVLYLSELELAFGTYPHPELLLLEESDNDGSGMEYAGAARAGSANLLHELVHMYFGRSVLPSGGDAGWIDEAIAYWYVATRGRSTGSSSPPNRPTNIGARSVYSSNTSHGDHLVGVQIMRYVDAQLPRGLVPTLRRFHEEYSRKTVSTPEFQRFLERELGHDIEDWFRTAVYGLE